MCGAAYFQTKTNGKMRPAQDLFFTVGIDPSGSVSLKGFFR
jgi:hypothetical protein